MTYHTRSLFLLLLLLVGILFACSPETVIESPQPSDESIEPVARREPAEVESIEPYGDGGKYKLNFIAPAKPIGPIKFGRAKQGILQSPRYTSYEKLLSAKEVVDLFE